MKRKYKDIRMNAVRKNSKGWFVVGYVVDKKTRETKWKRVTCYLKHQSYANKVADILEYKYDCYGTHAILIEDGYIWKLDQYGSKV